MKEMVRAINSSDLVDKKGKQTTNSSTKQN